MHESGEGPLVTMCTRDRTPLCALWPLYEQEGLCAGPLLCAEGPSRLCRGPQHPSVQGHRPSVQGPLCARRQPLSVQGVHRFHSIDCPSVVLNHTSMYICTQWMPLAQDASSYMSTAMHIYAYFKKQAPISDLYTAVKATAVHHRRAKATSHCLHPWPTRAASRSVHSFNLTTSF